MRKISKYLSLAVLIVIGTVAYSKLSKSESVYPTKTTNGIEKLLFSLIKKEPDNYQFYEMLGDFYTGHDLDSDAQTYYDSAAHYQKIK